MTWRNIGSVTDSPFARLDFRSKLALLIAATCLAFLWEDPLLTGCLAVLILALNLAARVRASYLGRVLALMLPFYALLLITHGFWNTSVGRTALWTAPRGWWLVGGSLTLWREGLTYGLMVIFRTLTLILVTPLTIFTTDLNALIVGLVRLHVPYQIAFAFSATLRFIPLLFEEIRSITEAQRLRGLALERMGVWQRLVVYSRIAVPLILGAMVRSQQIEVALAAKAFSGSPQRTYLHESKLRRADWTVILLSVALLLLAVVLRVTTGLGKFA
jgi:energy-coupling factor transport system permease protein